MKKLFLHIGMHKTGTTSIQENLAAARDVLFENDILYPSIKPYNHTVSFTPIFSNNPLADITFIEKGIRTIKAARIEQDRLKRMWEIELSKNTCTKTIISAEGCSMLLEDRVREMKGILDQYFDEIVVLIYVREPMSFYTSLIQQRLKHMDHSLDDFSFRKPNQLYTRRIPQYMNVFGEKNVIIRPFNKMALYKNDLIDDFFKVIKCDIDTSQIKRDKVNESLGMNATIILSELNKYYPGYNDGIINAERGLSKNLEKVLEMLNSVEDRKLEFDFHFSEEDVEYLNNEIDYINTYLDKEYQFQRVLSVKNSAFKYSISNVDDDYMVRLINAYNKELEKYFDGSKKSVFGKLKSWLKKYD